MKKLLPLFFLLSFTLSGVELLAQTSGGLDICPLYVPKAFTPNGDNLNETFLIRVSEDCVVKSYHVTIFDRWGQIAYESNSLLESDAWDGRIKGQMGKAGVYMYQISVNMVHQAKPNNKAEVKTLQGSLVLLR